MAGKQRQRTRISAAICLLALSPLVSVSRVSAGTTAHRLGRKLGKMEKKTLHALGQTGESAGQLTLALGAAAVCDEERSISDLVAEADHRTMRKLGPAAAQSAHPSPARNAAGADG
jgi:hypothetical protein